MPSQFPSLFLNSVYVSDSALHSFNFHFFICVIAFLPFLVGGPGGTGAGAGTGNAGLFGVSASGVGISSAYNGGVGFGTGSGSAGSGLFGQKFATGTGNGFSFGK